MAYNPNAILSLLGGTSSPMRADPYRTPQTDYITSLLGAQDFRNMNVPTLPANFMLGRTVSPLNPEIQATVPDAQPQSLLSALGQGIGERFSDPDFALAFGTSMLRPRQYKAGIGQSIAEGLLAGRGAQKANQQEMLANLLTDAKISDLTGGPFKGTGMVNQAWNTIYKLADKVKDGTATDDELSLYKTAEQIVSKPSVETRTDPATSETYTVKVAGADLESSGLPSFAPKEVETGRKPPSFNDAQLKSSQFAVRMRDAEIILRDLEEKMGYDPTTAQDYFSRMAPSGLRSFFMTPQGQRYNQAKEQFILAVMRQESGAAITQSEFEDKERVLFPQVGDTPETIRQKSIARKKEIESMINSSGGAYQASYGKDAMDVFANYDDGGGSFGSKENPYIFPSVEGGNALPKGKYFRVGSNLYISDGSGAN